MVGVKGRANQSLHLTGLARADFKVGFAIAVGPEARLTLQTRPAGELRAVRRANRHLIHSWRLSTETDFDILCSTNLLSRRLS